MSHHIFFKKKLLRINSTPDTPTPTPEINYTEKYLTYEFIQGDVTVQVRTNANTITYYKINDNDWQKLNIIADPEGGILSIGTIDLVEGQKIQFAANALDLTWEINFDYPSNQTTLYNIYGNYMSIIYADTSDSSNFNYTDFSTKTKFPQIQTDANGNPLYNIKVITPAVYNAENFILPATTLFDGCYASMFSGCTELVTAPELPATALASDCYNSMFSGCTWLRIAPALPATTLAPNCYASMFSGCTELAIAPTLPATTLAQGCYENMFYDCTFLRTAPALPATKLAPHCYRNMFYGCAFLRTAPVLPATTLAESCYNCMFMHCSLLTTAPALPATTLANYCYGGMFSYCHYLVTAPELPANTLVKYCYTYMFTGCSSLNHINMLATDISAENCLNGWTSGVADNGTFVKHPNMNSLPTGENGIPEGWTIINI